MKRVKGSDNNKRSVDTVFVLMIFCGFAISVLLALMLSGSIYQNMITTAREGQGERIALSYIRTRVRNFDKTGAIFVGEFGGSSALFFHEELGGRNFATTIYLYGGFIRELFHEIGEDTFPFLPSDGTELIRAESLDFVKEGNLIKVSTEYGNIMLHPRSMLESGGL